MGSIKKLTISFLAFSFFSFISNFYGVEGHARITEPVGRSTIWRLAEFLHLNPPENVNDDALRCGGVNQAKDPGTACGVCRDDISQPSPRDNEVGGRFYSGIIVANYTSGQVKKMSF